MNGLFGKNILAADRPRYPTKINQIEFREYQMEVEEGGVKLRLRVTEVLGFGEIGQTKNSREIKEHVQRRLKERLIQEQSPKQRSIGFEEHQGTTSGLFHAALVLVGTNRHTGVAHAELELMRELKQLVHVIPILSKADTLLPGEYEAMKAKIQECLTGIGLDFPAMLSPADEPEILRQAQEIRTRFPLFVSCAPTYIQNEGEVTRQARHRLYPWGSCCLESEEWNDFGHLQRLLVRTFLAFLKISTEDNIYEAYRRGELSAKTVPVVNEIILTPPSISSALSVDESVTSLKQEKKQKKSPSSKKTVNIVENLYEPLLVQNGVNGGTMVA